ncbi:MAG: DUF4252 domain-containing protein [Bacteroidales bacterium]|nr:DUF4252 domain-containing protein [Bacteroidales bacterium]
MKRSNLKNLLILIVFVPVLSWSQESSADKIFEQYSDKDGFTSVDITKGLFELFAEIDADDPEFEEFQQALKGLESLRLLAYSLEDGKGNQAEKEKFIQDVRDGVSLKDFKELMVIRDEEANINFYAKNNNQIITEMIMIVDGKDEAVLLSLSGDIDLNHIAKLGSAMDMGGMQYLGKMKSK